MEGKKLNIVIVGPAYPYRGGQALVEAYLHYTFTQLGYNASTISYTVLYPSIFFPGTTQFDNSSFIAFEHSSKIKRLIHSVNPFTWLKTAKEIRSRKPDFVLFVWWMPFFGPALSTIARLVKKDKHTKIVFLIENFISHENRWFDKFSTKYTLKYADAFICQSQYIYTQIKNIYPDKQTLQTTLSVYDCFDLKKYNQQTARAFLNIKTENVILFFGLIRPYKGLDKLIIAFKALLKKQPDTTLLIVGECYENIEKYTQLIAALELEEKTMLHNCFVANEHIEPYFKAADLCCLPYNSGTQSGILMMAYGFRIPVVATNVGGVSELIIDKETGIIIKDNTVENLDAGLSFVTENKNKINFANNIAKFTESLGYKNLQHFFENIA